MDYYLVFHNWGHSYYRLLSSNDDLWLHIVFHVILIIVPISFSFVLMVFLFKFIFKILKKKVTKNIPVGFSDNQDLPTSILPFIVKLSFKKQIILCIGSLAILPVTYASLELPKRIINEAINAENFSKKAISLSVNQPDYLLFLCALFLLVIIASAVIKYLVNIYRGIVAESLIRTLREDTYRKYRMAKKPSRAIIPILVQEVEPVGGFSGDSFSLPILQGGTALTIILFMMVQNIALGIAAITLLPVQMLVIPYFQRKINHYVRERVLVARSLSNSINRHEHAEEEAVNNHFNTLHDLRMKIFKKKYLMKSTNNLLMNLTPFFFYTIGGFLVIKNELSLGALIASLASYKDMASSIRELFSYYQRLQDVKIRYGEIYKYANEELIA